jgi:hypothetical protein
LNQPESYCDLVDRLFKKVKAHMGWSDEKTCIWFQSKNQNFGGLSPDDFIARRPSRAEKFIDLLINGDRP